MSKATLDSIEKDQELYYVKVSDPTQLYKVLVEDITDTHYLIRFNANQVYEVKKHKRSITNYYHTREAAVAECQKRITDAHNEQLLDLTAAYLTNLEDAGNHPIFWDGSVE